MEYVYIIQCSESKAVKIGRTSSRNPHQRISSIQTSNPFRLNTIRIIACDRGLEWRLHQQFSSYRIDREWFKPECLPLLLDVTAGYEEYKRDQRAPSTSVKVAVLSSGTATEEGGDRKSKFSGLIDFLFRPKYRSENAYIDSLWEKKAALEGVSVQECFENQLREKGYSILIEAYEVGDDLDAAVAVFADLREYHERVVRDLRDPITPFGVFASEGDSQARKDWEEKRAAIIRIADSLDERFRFISELLAVHSYDKIRESWAD